jgi:hypothetical protein
MHVYIVYNNSHSENSAQEKRIIWFAEKRASITVYMETLEIFENLDFNT